MSDNRKTRQPLVPLADLYMNTKQDGSGKYLSGRMNKYQKIMVLPIRPEERAEDGPTHRIYIVHDEYRPKPAQERRA